MRDYLIVGIILTSLPIGLISPFYGLLTYAWISYMNPHMLAWGFAQTFPVAKVSAFSAVAGTVFARAADLSPLRHRETIWMILFWCMLTISTFLSVNPLDAWPKWQDVSKLVIMAVLTATLLTDHKRIRYFLLVIALSLGFYGLKAGIFSLVTGGEYMVHGPGTSIIGSNNSIGLALNMCLPLLWYLAQDERGLLKWLLRIMFFMTIPAIMFTYSRASALTIPIVLLPLILRGRSKFLLLSAVLIGGLIALSYAPDKWWDRQGTVITYEKDGSAMSRIDNWKFCWKVALDHPLTGAGFEFYTRQTFLQYAPEFLLAYGGKTFNSHNIYFGILAAHGFPGITFFGGMVLFCLLSCRRMQKQVADRPDLKWVATYCKIVNVSFLAFLVNGFFVNMEYFDLPYHLVAIVASLKVISERALAESDLVAENLVLDRSLVATAS